jgi:hypothetical protein
MATQTSQLVNTMAKMTVSNEMLEKIDIKNLLSEFSQDYDKLDNLKKFRQRHDERNAVSRWWNNDELETAQLNAAELQASFSKKLGQLMVISIAQSQQLNKQQGELAEQQQTIKKQTEQLARNADQLSGQHQHLEAQNNELEELFRNYLALRGLTENGAKKLIEVAQQIQGTRDELIGHFDQRMSLLNQHYQQIASELAQLHSQLDERVAQINNDVRLSQNAVLQSVNEQSRRIAQNESEQHKHVQDLHQQCEMQTQALSQLTQRLDVFRAENLQRERRWRLWTGITTPLLALSVLVSAWLCYVHYFSA